jgi:ABC-type branched-subunit amino acid transport system ATPase component
MSDIVMNIKALPHHFGAFAAVYALILSVNAGEVFGMLGSYGAGKTTALNENSNRVAWKTSSWWLMLARKKQKEFRWQSWRNEA